MGLSAEIVAKRTAAVLKAYLYTEGSDNQIGMAVLFSKDLGSVKLVSGSDHISDRAAAFLGLTHRRSSWVAEYSKRKWELEPGMKLLENRESGAYLWTRGDPEDEVDLETRLPGWRIKIGFGEKFVARGMRPAAKTLSLLPWWVGAGHKPPREPRIVLGQVIQFESPGTIIKDARLFAIVCWAPADLYSAYETVFENVLSGLRVYAREAITGSSSAQGK
jgi:hypothetical protein